MAGCYECQHCGKCTYSGPPVAQLILACKDCGHEVNPGEDPSKCVECGSTNIGYIEGAANFESVAAFG